MLETLSNGILDAWWEYAILIIISVPIWSPFLWLLMYGILKLTVFTLSLLPWRLS